jgi:hypothetical protein
LLQSILGAHSRIRAFPESHFFARISGAQSTVAWSGLRDFFDRSEIGEENVSSAADVQVAFVETLDRAALSSGADLWSEKTPRHLHHVAEIVDAVPEVAFLHIIREGHSTVQSLHRVTKEFPEHWGGKPRSIRRCARRWVADVETSLSYAEDPRHHLVRYERLVARPASVAQQICAFLEIEEDAEMLRSHAEVAEAISAPEESWKDRAARPIASPDRQSVAPLDAEVARTLAPLQERIDLLLPAE